MLPQSALGVKQDEVPALPPLSGFYLAQVVTPLPIDHALEVILPSLSGILNGSSSNALKVHVMEHRAGPYHGDLDLPRKGDWGIVVFPHGSDLHPVWLGSLYQDFNSLATANEQEKISHHDSGIWTKTDKDGNYEFAYPDGSYLRIGSGTALSGRTRQRRQGSARENLSYSVPSKPAPTVYFKHSTGTAITIDPAGNITLSGSAEVTVESQVSGPHVHIDGRWLKISWVSSRGWRRSWRPSIPIRTLALREGWPLAILLLRRSPCCRPPIIQLMRRSANG